MVCRGAFGPVSRVGVAPLPGSLGLRVGFVSLLEDGLQLVVEQRRLVRLHQVVAFGGEVHVHRRIILLTLESLHSGHKPLLWSTIFCSQEMLLTLMSIIIGAMRQQCKIAWIGYVSFTA